MKTVLFVCSGNTCRSPMAMAFFNDLMTKEDNKNFVADSAGLAAMRDAINPKSAKSLSKIDIDFNNYRSKSLTTDMLFDSYLVVTMTLEQKTFLENIVGGKVPVLLLGQGIPDPYGGSQEEYDLCLEKIKEGIESLLIGGWFDENLPSK